MGSQINTCLLLLLLISSLKAGAQEACQGIFQHTDNSLNSLFQSQVVAIRKGPAASEPGYILSFESGEKGFFKPIDMGQEKRTRLYGYQSPYHEVAAFEVSELFGFGVVPRTVLKSFSITKNHQAQLGSLQLFIVGRTPRQIEQKTGEYIRETDKIALFDLLIGNIDRSDRNYIITKNNDQWAIDNASSFYTSNSLKTNLENPKGPSWLRPKIVKVLTENPEILSRLRSVTNAEIRLKLKGILRPSQISPLIERRDNLISVATEAGL